jgi:xylulokinase
LKYFLGLDLGTTNCKCLLLDENKEITASASVDCELLFTSEGVEQNAENWWNDAVLAIRKLFCVSKIDPRDISAMSISSQGISGVPVDIDGNPLYSALSWLDARSESEADEIKTKFGEDYMYRQTGKNALCYSFLQLMWIKNNLPEIYSKIWKYMLPLDYLNFKFTGKAMMDLSMASGTYAFDISKHKWISELFSYAKIPESIFSDLGEMGGPVGYITKKAGEQTGLSQNTLVVMGAQDQRCASIGAGICPRVATVSLGTSAAVCSLIDRPLFDPERRVTCCAADTGHWVLESVVATACAALDWAKEMFFAGYSHKEIDEMAALAPDSGGVVFTPNLSENDKKNGGGTLGGFTLKTTKNEIARAVLEGVAIQLRDHLNIHETVNQKIDGIILFGGGAASEIWTRIIAEITQKKTSAPKTRETAAFGAAIIAGAKKDFWDGGDFR